MKKSLFPSVTFVIPTYNSQSTIRMCLQSIADLDYPSSKIRVLVMDGGSQDKTIQIAKSYRFCQVHSIKTDGPEEATARGYMMITTKYAVNFPSDNVITHTDWLRRMVAPLEANDLLVASEPWRYAYIQNDTVLNRYFALFGVNDPVAYYLGKRDRITYFENSLAFVKKRTEKKEYIQVEFTTNTLPTVGANGFVIRSQRIKKVAKNTQQFSHIDSCRDLLEQGHAQYAFVKTDIWHKTGESLGAYLTKRRTYVRTLYFEKKRMRRYHVFDPSADLQKLIFYIIASCTIVQPLLLSIRGYKEVRDPAWFLHPFICWIMLVLYAYETIRYYALQFVARLRLKTL